MIGLPRIVGSGPISTDVTDDSRISDYLGPLAVAGVVEGLLVLSSADVPKALKVLRVDFASAFVAELSTLQAGLLEFHLTEF